MEFSSKKNFIVVFFIAFPLALVFYFIIGNSESIKSQNFAYKISNASNFIKSKDNLQSLPQKLSNPPPVIKAIFVTSWSAGSKSYFSYLNQLLKTTKVNAVVIDLKDYSGAISYKSEMPKVKEYKTFKIAIYDIDKIVESLHNQGIYVIARINVFNDSLLAIARPDLAVYTKSTTETQSKPVLWKDNSMLYWLDPASQEVWDYNIEIAKEAAQHGFDEINFDYIRFPSDGKIKDIGFPVFDYKIERHLVVKNFFKKIRESLPNVKISIDVFGQTTTNPNDLGIGQLFEDTFDYFDYVCPMVYPSHYVNGFLNYDNPSEHPYEIIKYSIDSALLRQSTYKNENPGKNMAKIRPWLQDFNLGANYDAEMVKQEIKAVEDSTGKDFKGFLLWNPSNFYTKEAIALDSSEPR